MFGFENDLVRLSESVAQLQKRRSDPVNALPDVMYSSSVWKDSEGETLEVCDNHCRAT